MVKLVSIFLVLSVFHTTCREKQPQSGVGILEKYAVYASIIKSAVDSTRIEVSCVKDSTVPIDGFLTQQYLELMNKWWADFVPEDFMLEPNVLRQQPLRIDSIQPPFGICGRDEVTDDAHEMRNTATLSFSGVVTNLKGNEALVFANCVYSHGIWASWFWLGKSGGEWRILGRRLVLVS